MDGWFKAVDAKTGELKWRFKTGSGIIGQPVAYRGPDGHEYVAILSGVGGWAGAIVSGDLDPRDPTGTLGMIGVMAECRRASHLRRSQQSPVLGPGRPGFREQNRRADCTRSRFGHRLYVVGTRRGYVRHTLKADLCDIWPGVASGGEMMTSTRPYYRSSYVFVTRADRGLHIASFDDPRLRKLLIGVQMVGSDAMNTPPAHALARRGIVQNVRGYMLYGDYRQPHPPSAIIDAVEDGDVDVAVVRGPMAGYFAAQGSKPLTIEPVQPSRDSTELPMAFYVSMGVRRGDNALLQRLDDSLERHHAAISAILADYHVPTLPDAFAPP